MVDRSTRFKKKKKKKLSIKVFMLTQSVFLVFALSGRINWDRSAVSPLREDMPNAYSDSKQAFVHIFFGRFDQIHLKFVIHLHVNTANMLCLCIYFHVSLSVMWTSLAVQQNLEASDTRRSSLEVPVMQSVHHHLIWPKKGFSYICQPSADLWLVLYGAPHEQGNRALYWAWCHLHYPLPFP